MAGLRQGTIYFTDLDSIPLSGSIVTNHRVLYTLENNGVYVIDSSGNNVRLDNEELIAAISGSLSNSINGISQSLSSYATLVVTNSVSGNLYNIIVSTSGNLQQNINGVTQSLSSYATHIEVANTSASLYNIDVSTSGQLYSKITGAPTQVALYGINGELSGSPAFVITNGADSNAFGISIVTNTTSGEAISQLYIEADNEVIDGNGAGETVGIYKTVTPRLANVDGSDAIGIGMSLDSSFTEYIDTARTAYLSMDVGGKVNEASTIQSFTRQDSSLSDNTYSIFASNSLYASATGNNVYGILSRANVGGYLATKATGIEIDNIFTAATLSSSAEIIGLNIKTTGSPTIGASGLKAAIKTDSNSGQVRIGSNLPINISAYGQEGALFVSGGIVTIGDLYIAGTMVNGTVPLQRLSTAGAVYGDVIKYTTSGVVWGAGGASSGDLTGFTTKTETYAVSSNLYSIINSTSGNLQQNIDGLSQSLSAYTLLSITNSLTGQLQTNINNNYNILVSTSGNLQTQINAIVSESTTVQSSGGTISVSQSGSLFNVEVFDYISKTEVASLTGALSYQISAATFAVYQGTELVTSISGTITHGTIPVSASHPIITLNVPDSDSVLYSPSVLNRTSSSFDWLLSSTPDTTGYSLNWVIVGQSGLGGGSGGGGGSIGLSGDGTLISTVSFIELTGTGITSVVNAGNGKAVVTIDGGAGGPPVVTSASGILFSPDGLDDIYDYYFTAPATINAPSSIVNGDSIMFKLNQPLAGGATLTLSSGNGFTWLAQNGVLTVSSDVSSGIDMMTVVRVGDKLLTSIVKNLKTF